MKVLPFRNSVLLIITILAGACATRSPVPQELVRPFNQAIYDVAVLIPDGSVEFTNLRATDNVSAIWVDAFRAKMQKAGYIIVKDASQEYDLTTRVVLDCVDSTLTLKLSDKQQVIDEIRIQEGLWLEACLNTRMTDYVATRLVNAYTRSANVSEFADNLEMVKHPSSASTEPVIPSKPVIALAESDGRSAVAAYPFSGQGGTEESVLEMVSRTFADDITKVQCMRVVPTETLMQVAKVLDLKDRCINETCQIDLARNARVDVLVRGVVSKVSGSYMVSTTVIDTTTRRILYSDKSSATEKTLASEAEKLSRRIRSFVICPSSR